MRINSIEGPILMDIHNLNYYCYCKKMNVSIGYCENCYFYNLHDGSHSWLACVEKNVSNPDIKNIYSLINKLKLVAV